MNKLLYNHQVIDFHRSNILCIKKLKVKFEILTNQKFTFKNFLILSYVYDGTIYYNLSFSIIGTKLSQQDMIDVSILSISLSIELNRIPRIHHLEGLLNRDEGKLIPVKEFLLSCD